MNRRNFLGGILALAASAATPMSALRSAAPDVLRLWGDGIHDDTAAIQALINRGGGFLPAGRYRVQSTLVLRAGQTLTSRMAA